MVVRRSTTSLAMRRLHDVGETSQGASVAVALAVLVAAMGWLCLSVSILPLTDYPNHLARLFIQSHIATDKVLAENYQLFWHFQPNLALDSVAHLLASAFDVYTIGRLLGAMTFGSLAIGLIILHRALHGWFSPAALLPIVLIVNRYYVWGSLGYLLALGLSFAAVAAWLACRDRPYLQLVTGTILATITYLGHLYAFSSYAICTIGYEVFLLSSKFAWRRGIARGAAVLGQLLPAVLLLLFVSPTVHADHAIQWRSFLGKLDGAIVLVPGYNPVWELLLVAIWFAIPLIAWLRGAGTLRWDFLVAAVAFVALYFVLPDRMFSGYGADRRLIVPLAMIILLSFDWALFSTRARLLQWMLVGSVAVAQIGYLAVQWHASDRSYTELLQMTTAVERGASVTGTTISATNQRLTFPPLDEAVALFVIERSAYVPDLFAYPGNSTSSPLMYRPPAVPLSREGRIINSTNERVAQAVFDWRLRQIEERDIDYLLLVDDGKFHLHVPVAYRLVDQTNDGRGRLFRICKMDAEWVVRSACLDQ